MNFKGGKWETQQYNDVLLYNGKTSFNHDSFNIILNIMEFHTAWPTQLEISSYADLEIYQKYEKAKPRNS